MAEQVQTTLDEMVAPLADLMDRNIFTQSEIHRIVDRRREYEYLLRRRSPRKSDYLKYLHDEMNLEKLRQLRMKQIKRKQKWEFNDLLKEDDNKNNKEHHIGDYHIISHIHILFQRAIRRFRSDVAIYVQYIEYCKESRSYKKLKQVYAEVLQFHPTQIELWIEAASYDFFTDTNIPGARVLLQRALRLYPTKEQLWHQYFCLEYHILMKLHGRKKILKLLSSSTTVENNKSNDDHEANNNEDPIDTSVVQIVYKNAIQAIPNSIPFRLEFIDLCKMFPCTDDMIQYIYKTIQSDFTNQPEAYILRAKYVMEQEHHKEKDPDDDDGDDNNSSSDKKDSSRNMPEGFLVAPSNEDKDDKEDSKNKNDRMDKKHPRSDDGTKTKQQDKRHKADNSDDSSNGDGDDNSSDTESNGDNENDSNESDSSSDNESIDDDKINNSSTTSTTTVKYNNNKILSILKEATIKIPTSDMYVRCIRFAWSYFYHLDDIMNTTANSNDSDDNNTDSKSNETLQGQILEFMEELFQLATKTTTKTTRIPKTKQRSNKRSSSFLYTSDIVLEYVDYLLRCEQFNDAKNELERFIAFSAATTNSSNNNGVDVKIWLRFIRLHWILLLQEKEKTTNDVEEVVLSRTIQEIFDRALHQTPIAKQPDYQILLLQRFGAELEFANRMATSKNTTNSIHKRNKKLEELFQQILLLLAPASTTTTKPVKGGTNNYDGNDNNNTDRDNNNNDENYEYPFPKIKSIADACYQYLLFCIEQKNCHNSSSSSSLGPVIESIRKVSTMVLLQSSFFSSSNSVMLCNENDQQKERDIQTMGRFIDMCIETEKRGMTKSNNNSSDKKQTKKLKQQQKQHLRKLYDGAIEFYKIANYPSLVQKYRSGREKDVMAVM